jgi:hypothetical protein
MAVMMYASERARIGVVAHHNATSGKLSVTVSMGILPPLEERPDPIFTVTALTRPTARAKADIENETDSYEV